MKIFHNLNLKIGFSKRRPQLALIDFTLSYFLLAPESYFNRFNFYQKQQVKNRNKIWKEIYFFFNFWDSDIQRYNLEF